MTQPYPSYKEGKPGNDLNPQTIQNWDLIISPNLPLRFQPASTPWICSSKNRNALEINASPQKASLKVDSK